MKKDVKALLIEHLDNSVVKKSFKQADRTLLLREVADDLQVGLVIQRYKKRGISHELVDIGVRIPSVERLIDQYATHRLQKMGFRSPEATEWLTLWRQTCASLELQERGLQSVNLKELGSQADSILREFVQFLKSIVSNLDGFRSEMLDLLAQARRPAWATMPQSSFLVSRALALRKLRGMDWSSDVVELLKNANVEKPYEDDVQEFCRWLQSTESSK